MEEIVKNKLNMKAFVRTIIWLAMLTLPLLSFGQLNLCDNCATAIVDNNNPDHCCEECIEDYFTMQLKRNIRHGKLSHYCDYQEISMLMPFPDTLSARFLVTSHETHPGYYLKESELKERTYYLINLICENCDTILSRTPIVLITDDSSSFKKGESYSLTITPYFKKNMSFLILDGKTYSVIPGGPRTLFDLVYKEWLIVMLPVGRNYFFSADTEQHQAY